jgi:1,4-alpha-glucan branching enzyme
MLTKKYFKTKDECEVTFELQRQANKVALVSEFSGWKPVNMKLRKKDKVFYTRMRLPIERSIQFRYLVDDLRWENDDSADEYVPNEFGGENSVVHTYR